MPIRTAKERFEQAQAFRNQPITVAGALLLRARQEAGLTQVEAAERIGCSPQRVSRVETGRSNPPIEELNAMLAPLGYEVRTRLEEVDDHDYVLARRAMRTGAAMTSWEEMARRRAFEHMGEDYDEAVAEMRRTNPSLEPEDEGYDKAIAGLVRRNPALAEVFER